MGRPAVDWKSLGREIKHVRTVSCRIGVREAAKEAGVSSATLSRAENGRACDVNTFFRLVKWLGMSPLYFVRNWL
jgi:transcriptional regulator with XRE-family HTH domain